MSRKIGRRSGNLKRGNEMSGRRTTYTAAEVVRFKASVFREHQNELAHVRDEAFSRGFAEGSKACRLTILDALGAKPKDAK